MAAKVKFRKNRRWRAFGEAYVRNGGDIAAAAKAAGVKKSLVYHRRKDDPEFTSWLEELTLCAMESAVVSADARLSRAVQNGESLEPQLLRTQDQLYKRAGKSRSTAETGGRRDNNADVGDKKDAILDKALELGLLKP